MNKVRATAIIAVFLIIILGLGIAQFILPDKELSYAERRKLNKAPELTSEAVLSGSYMSKLDSYLLDQFPMRDTFRSVKAIVKYDVLRQSDNNGVYLYGDTVAKLDTKLNENQILYGMDKISGVCESCFDGGKVAVALIPDKNYFIADEKGCPHLDYGRLVSLVKDNLPEGAEYIDLFDSLDISDYYRTDAHWSQERILPVASKLAAAFGMDGYLTPESGYTSRTLSPFYGVYYGQSALPLEPDDLVYLTSPLLEAATVTGPELDGEKSVYDESQIDGMDGYNVFLYGPQSILTIESPGAATDRELVIFRDSFGSSLAPLFAGAYSKITLIDLRYVSSSLLESYVELGEQDVLFIYSTTLMNTAMLLK